MPDCSCVQCGRAFYRTPSKVGRFCSTSCASSGRTTPHVLTRFMDKLRTSPNCWIWTGAVNSNGYGQLWVAGTKMYAHRFAYEYFIRPIPDGMNVLHRCDVARCVRPSHLYIGDQKQNGKDAADRVRMPRGKAHHAAKLTPNDVRAIRTLAGSIPQTKIAARFGVCQQTICDVVRGRYWRHVA